MRLYIAGPMRGYEKLNFPAFDEAEVRLRELGYLVVNPAKMSREAGYDVTRTYTDEQEDEWFRSSIVRDLIEIARCDGMALLPGWSLSEGAKIECKLAQALGLRFFDAVTCMELEEPDCIDDTDILPDRVSEPEIGGERGRLLGYHSYLCDLARQLMVAKNHDYAHGDDPYANFRGASVFGISPVKGILLRVVDKLKRIETFDTAGELKVSNESVQDAILDVINYAVLIYGIISPTVNELDA